MAKKKAPCFQIPIKLAMQAKEDLSPEEKVLFWDAVVAFATDGTITAFDDRYMHRLLSDAIECIRGGQEAYKRRSDAAKINVTKRWESVESVPNDTTVYDGIPNDTVVYDGINKNKNKKENQNQNQNQNQNGSVWMEIHESLREPIKEFVEMRNRAKKPVTDQALRLLVQELQTLSGDLGEQKRIVEQSIKHDWMSFYPLNRQDGGGKTVIEQNFSQRPNTENGMDDVPDWITRF